MGALRAGGSAFWTSVLSLVDTDNVTMDSLYAQGINRLSDRAVWLRDEITRRTAAIASTVVGTTAKVTGSADLSTLVYDATTGDLNGLTLQVQCDSAAIKTVTFATGFVASPGPGDVVNQINAATSSTPLATVDSAGHLSLESVVTGATGTVQVIGGSALALLGLTVGQNATGASSGADGISLIGGGQVAGSQLTLAAGSLRSMLQTVADSAVRAVDLAKQSASSGDSLVGVLTIVGSSLTIPTGTLRAALTYIAANAASLGANTFTGAQTRSGSAATRPERVLSVSAAFTTFTFATSQDVYTVSTPAAHQTWTATTTGAASGSHVVDVVVLASNISKGVQIIRDDASVICNLGGNGYAYCRLLLTGSRWVLIGIGGDTFSVVTPV